MPASASALAEPPVDRISTPCAVRKAPNSARPVLSDTEIRARRMAAQSPMHKRRIFAVSARSAESCCVAAQSTKPGGGCDIAFGGGPHRQSLEFQGGTSAPGYFTGLCQKRRGAVGLSGLSATGPYLSGSAGRRRHMQRPVHHDELSVGTMRRWSRVSWECSRQKWSRRLRPLQARATQK